MNTVKTVFGWGLLVLALLLVLCSCNTPQASLPSSMESVFDSMNVPPSELFNSPSLKESTPEVSPSSGGFSSFSPSDVILSSPTPSPSLEPVLPTPSEPSFSDDEESCPHTQTKIRTTKYYSCTEDGEEEVFCSECYQVLQVNIVPASHTFDEWYRVFDPTEESPGEDQRHCICCPAYESRPVEPLAHTHVPRTVEGQPSTCKKEGYSSYIDCEGCGEVLTPPTALPLADHREGREEILSQATCRKEGRLKRYCAECGVFMREEVISLLPHTEGDSIWNPKPSCFTDGLEECHCTVCGGLVWKKELPAFGQHDFLVTSLVKESTCTEKGYEEKYCYRCRELLSTNELPLKDHNYIRLLKTPSSVEEGGLIYKCFDCGYSRAGDEVIRYGDYSKGLSYQINADGIGCTVDGRGSCGDEILYIPPEIDGYTVTAIADGAFSSDRIIRFLILPHNLQSVGAQAFYGTELEDVYIPETVSNIGRFAFGDTLLTFVCLPDTVTDINDGVFAYCAILKEIQLGIHTKTIGGWAFKDCIHLKKITLPEGLIRICDEAFFNCSGLESIKIPESLRILEEGAFLYCRSLKSVALPDGFSTLEPWVFGHCSALSHIRLPASLKSIGDYAFYGCTSLAEITFHKGLEYIGFEAFQYDTDLKLTIRFMGSREEWNAVSKHEEWRPSKESHVVICN